MSKRVVARVNSWEIHQRDLNMALRLHIAQLEENGEKVSLSSYPSIAKSVLGELIDNCLLYEKCVSEGVVVPDEEVEDVIDDIRTSLDPGVDLEEAVARVGYTLEEVKARIHRDIMVSRLRGNIISEVKVSDDECREFYKSCQEDLGDINYEEVQEGIKDFIQKTKARAVLEEVLVDLRKAATIEIHL